MTHIDINISMKILKGHPSKVPIENELYLDCSQPLGCMLAHVHHCLVVSFCTKEVAILLTTHGSEAPDFVTVRVHFNSNACVKLLHVSPLSVSSTSYNVVHLMLNTKVDRNSILELK